MERREFGTEFFCISFGKGAGPGCKIGKSPESEDRARYRPCEYSKADPFGKFSKIVGGGHESVHPFSGDVVARVSGFPEIAYHVVGMNVDCHAA